MFMRRPAKRVTAFLLPVAILAFVLICAVLASAGIGESASREGLRLTEESVRRAAVQCYALEGAYPESLAYLKEHYGLSPDERRYMIDYRFIASNLMPDITVLPRVG